MTGPAVQADAQSVVDWFRAELAGMTHRAAFAECALAGAQRQADELRGELDQLSMDLGELQESARRSAQAADEAHWLRPEHPDFPAWVSEHWEQIQDAHLARMLEQAHAQTAATERP